MKVKLIAPAWLLALTGSTLLFPHVATIAGDINSAGKVTPEDFEEISIQFYPSLENYFRAKVDGISEIRRIGWMAEDRVLRMIRTGGTRRSGWPWTCRSPWRTIQPIWSNTLPDRRSSTSYAAINGNWTPRGCSVFLELRGLAYLSIWMQSSGRQARGGKQHESEHDAGRS